MNNTYTINDAVKDVHALAVEKGWHVDNESEVIEKGKLSTERKLAMHMLMVTELAEATEEIRNGKPDLYWETPTGRMVQDDVGGGFNLSIGLGNATILQKPEGEMSELADVVIRIMDYFGLRGWDLGKIIAAKHQYNSSRTFRHGNKQI